VARLVTFIEHQHKRTSFTMVVNLKPVLQPSLSRQISKASNPIRHMASQAKPARKEGDISSVFVSLSGQSPIQLPDRYIKIKQQLIQGNEDRLTASWKRLLEKLAVENESVAEKGPSIIPQIDFADLKTAPKDFFDAVKKRGVAVVRGVVPEDEARGFKTEIEEYVRANPSTKGFFCIRVL
jgi:hypothetical protein